MIMLVFCTKKVIWGLYYSNMVSTRESTGPFFKGLPETFDLLPQ